MSCSHKVAEMIVAVSAVLLLIGFASSAPAGVHIGEDGTVGASFGGYSASAGLGGIVGGGGTRGNLHAEAASPTGHFASAGLGGTAVSQGPGTQGQLYATAGRIDVPVEVVQGGSQAQSQAQASSGPVLQPQPQPQPQPNVFDSIFNIPISTLGAVNQYLNNRRKVEANSQPLGVDTRTKVNQVDPNNRTKYDDIFNIPISVLNSVNRFLNG